MGDNPQRDIDTKAIAMAAEAVGTVKAFRDFCSAIMARIDSNERRQEQHEIECHQERKDAKAARDKLRDDILGQQNVHHLENRTSIGALHGRMDDNAKLQFRVVLGLCSACILLIVSIVGLALKQSLGW